jgi:hypothetical protein
MDTALATFYIPFEVLLQAAQQLGIEQKALLARSLQLPVLNLAPTRGELLAELESLRLAKAFEHVESLRNKFACSNQQSLNDEDLLAELRIISTAWEAELDEFFSNSN